jgi:two-component system, OmpR family, sensor kinase
VIARPALRPSLTAKLSFVFFAITLLAIAALYLYVAPGLQNRLLGSKLDDLRATASEHSAQLKSSVGSSMPLRQVRQLVMSTSVSTNNRVTLLSVNQVQGQTQLTMQMDSSMPGSRPTQVRAALALSAVATRRIVTGIESTPVGKLAEATDPVVLHGRVAAVIVFTAPIADVLRTVSTVRREILIAGGISLLVALVAGVLVARALARRVRRLERAAQQVAAGIFADPLPVDSHDELGQLTAAFNEMQQQLQALEQARKRFIATASHELRTPIFSLGGFVELLEDEELDAETRRRFLEQIRNQVHRLGKLSVDLLDLSRLEAGSLELRPEEVDLGELTRSVSGEFEPTLTQRDAHLELRLPGARDRVEASCDPVRVAQIVRILIDNALTHTPPGTSITVSAARENGDVMLAVRDDGEGIDGQALPRIFEPFYTSDDAQGSGLGLAIASELAGRMRGRLSVDSGAGETTFTLRLPAATDS